MSPRGGSPADRRRRARRVFCGRFGSPVLKRVAARPGEIRLRRGCLDSDLDPKPMLHMFVSEKPGWSAIHDDLPRIDALPKVSRG